VGVVALVGVAFPLLTYHVVEAPLRAWRPKPLVAIACMLAAIAVACGWNQLVASVFGPELSRLPTTLLPTCQSDYPGGAFEWRPSAFSDLSTVTAFGRSDDHGCACRFCEYETTSGGHRPPQALGVTSASDNTPSLCMSVAPLVEVTEDDDPCAARGDPSPLWEKSETSTVSEAEMDEVMEFYQPMIKSCLKPDRTSKNLPKATIFLVGDSHARTFTGALSLATRGLFQVRTLSMNGVGIMKYGHTPLGARLMSEVNKALGDYMREGDLVVLRQESNDFVHAPGADKRLEDFLLKGIKPNGGHLVIFTDWPVNLAPLGEDRSVVDKLAKRQPSLVHVAHLSEHFCSKSAISGISNAVAGKTDSTMGTDVAGCETNVPGTAGLDAYMKETNADGSRKYGHLSSAGEVYLWPYVCDEMEAIAKKVGITASARSE